MTEKDYIFATDLRAVDCAADALWHIVPANDPAIDPEEYRTVMHTVSVWRERLHDRIRRCRDGSRDRSAWRTK